MLVGFEEANKLVELVNKDGAGWNKEDVVDVEVENKFKG